MRGPAAETSAPMLIVAGINLGYAGPSIPTKMEILVTEIFKVRLKTRWPRESFSLRTLFPKHSRLDSIFLRDAYGAAARSPEP